MRRVQTQIVGVGNLGVGGSADQSSVCSILRARIAFTVTRSFPWEVLLCDAETGVLLNDDGRWNLNTVAHEKLLFKTKQQAEAACIALSRRFIHAEASTHLADTGERVGSGVRHPEFQAFDEERTAYLRWLSHPAVIRVFRTDPSHRFREQLRWLYRK
jgi:hypothetical protein